MDRKILVFLASILLVVLTTQTVQAGPLLGGALRGAIIGDLVDGRDGARKGAVIGGLIGAGRAAGQRKHQREQQEAAALRQEEWAAQERAEQARIQQQQAADAPAIAANQTLVVETQKSLIRLGFDPGDVGTNGPALTNAVKEYQSGNGLLETGELSQELLTHMIRNGG
jgi:hypothetical protein